MVGYILDGHYDPFKSCSALGFGSAEFLISLNDLYSGSDYGFSSRIFRQVYDLTVLSDLKGFLPFSIEKVSFRWLCLLDAIGSVR